jgi:hypothetical protein
MTAQTFSGTGGDVERAQLAPTAHAVRVGRDLVLLDLEIDDYLLIPDCPDLEICGDRVAGPMALLLDLSANELLRSGAFQPPRPAAPALPGKGLPEAPSRSPSLRDVATFGLIWADAARRRPTLQALARRFSARHGRRDDLAALSARVAVFRQMLPFAPSVGACLFQAELLLRFLNAGGLDADWVFGVRTFPFLAHCWLQVGDHCVSQSPETLAIYRPIMAL